jgi:hypothetical protein
VSLLKLLGKLASKRFTIKRAARKRATRKSISGKSISGKSINKRVVRLIKKAYKRKPNSKLISIKINTFAN